MRNACVLGEVDDGKLTGFGFQEMTTMLPMTPASIAENAWAGRLKVAVLGCALPLGVGIWLALFPSQEFCFIPAVVCELRHHGAFVEVKEKFWELILSSQRGSEVANWWSSGLQCKHFHLRAPGYPLWYATAVSLVSLAQGQDCTRLRSWKGLTLLLGSP